MSKKNGSKMNGQANDSEPLSNFQDTEKTGRKGSKENPVVISASSLKSVTRKLKQLAQTELRSFSIIEASLKDEICNYKYEVIEGIGLGDQHNVNGSGIVKDTLLQAFANFNVHLACIDEVFKHSKMEVGDIDTMHNDELTGLYRVSWFKVKTNKGYDTIQLKGMKYVSSAGGWMELKSPEVTLDNLSSYKWWNELKTAADTAREEVSLYKEGNYTPVEIDEEKDEDKKQASLFGEKETAELEDELTGAEI
jgi:hypothetical protein